MEQLSPEEREVIEQHPLESLDPIRQALRDAESSTSSEPPLLDDSASAPQRPKLFHSLIQELISIFIFSKVCLQLASRAGNAGLHHDLLLVRHRIASQDIDYRHLRQLSLCLINQAPDADIWTTIINLIPKILVFTPPKSITTSFETPITHSSASLQGSEQTRPKVEARIFDEIRHCTYRSVQGFHEKYFEGRTWRTRAQTIWESAQSQYSNKRWTNLPQAATEDDVWVWWSGLQNLLLADERAAYYRSTLSNMVGPDAPRQLDLLVKRKKGDAAADEKHDWKNVLVVGELKMTDRKSKALWLQIASAVRSIFTAQPTRLFVHAFTLAGTTMETWVFDRSGPYSGIKFDVHEQPEKFIQVMCGYLMMSDEELGLETFIKEVDGRLFVTFPAEISGTQQKQEFELEPSPMAYQRAIVCRGTSCFLAKEKDAVEYDRVVKLSWTSSMRPPEADLLRKANERGVKGLAKLVGYHEEVTSIRKLREGLVFSSPYKYRGVPSSTHNSLSWSQAQSGAPLSRSASLSNTSNRNGKRKSTDAISHQSKRSRRSSQANDRNGEDDEVSYSVQEPQGTSLALRDEPGMTYDNRIFRALAISPAGRSISQFQSSTELLQGLRDAITVHRSLYLDGKILHRDISENNIIITDPAKADGFRGMLIDLDLAKEEGQGTSGARHRTGTMEFMAIEVLTGASHTYRHDLEAFFYVLIWLCARRGWDKPPKKTVLSQWYTGDYKAIARSKRGDMDVGGFEDILREFPPNFDFVKPLCRKLRDILFPYKHGLFTGTPQNPKVLYDPIIKAYDDILAEMDAGSLGAEVVPRNKK